MKSLVGHWLKIIQYQFFKYLLQNNPFKEIATFENIERIIKKDSELATAVAQELESF